MKLQFNIFKKKDKLWDDPVKEMDEKSITIKEFTIEETEEIEKRIYKIKDFSD